MSKEDIKQIVMDESNMHMWTETFQNNLKHGINQKFRSCHFPFRGRGNILSKMQKLGRQRKFNTVKELAWDNAPQWGKWQKTGSIRSRAWSQATKEQTTFTNVN